MTLFSEPEEAATSYEIALRDNPKSIQIIKKLGCALVQMHEFDKATTHYENAIKNLNDEELKYEYLELLIKVSTIICLCFVTFKSIHVPAVRISIYVFLYMYVFMYLYAI